MKIITLCSWEKTSQEQWPRALLGRWATTWPLPAPQPGQLTSPFSRLTQSHFVSDTVHILMLTVFSPEDYVCCLFFASSTACNVPKIKVALSTCWMSSVQSISHVWLFATPWAVARQASRPSPTPGLLKLMSTELVMPSNHLSLCCPLLPPSIFPRIKVFSNESVLCIRWSKTCWIDIL